MKVYQKVAWVSHTYYDKIDMAESVGKFIKRFQRKNWQVEVQYSTCATDNQINYSALILAYTEE